MKKEFKFNIDDVVYFVGDHRIYQAKIIEVRYVKRYKEQNHYKDKDKPFEIEEFELYRLARDKSYKNDFTNAYENYRVYKGEFNNYDWFPVDILYTSEEAALKSISVEYLTRNIEN